MGGGIGALLSGQREAGDADLAGHGELPCSGTVAAADIHALLARFKVQPVCDGVDQRLDGLVGCLAARHPQPVMNMVPPHLAVNGIELVVVVRDRRGILGNIGDDHGTTLQRRSTATKGKGRRRHLRPALVLPHLGSYQTRGVIGDTEKGTASRDCTPSTKSFTWSSSLWAFRSWWLAHPSKRMNVSAL